MYGATMTRGDNDNEKCISEEFQNCQPQNCQY